MRIDFMLLTGCTAMDVAVDIRGKAWPPKLQGNELASFENARVTNSGMIMVTSDNGVAEVGISRNIDMTLVG